MGVRVTGQFGGGSRCCTKKCLNDPILTWQESAFAGPATVTKNGTGWHVSILAPGTVLFVDVNGQKLVPSNTDFCFTTELQRLTSPIGPTIRSGYTTLDLNSSTANASHQLYIEDNGFQFRLAIGGTSHVLAPSDTKRHSFKVCRVGGIVTVRIDGGAVQSFAAGNLPNVALSPFTAIINSDTDTLTEDFLFFCRNK